MIRVVLVLYVYIWGYMYMGVLRILLFCFHCVPYSGNCWATIKIFYRYANHECVSRMCNTLGVRLAFWTLALHEPKHHLFIYEHDLKFMHSFDHLNNLEQLRILNNPNMHDLNVCA
jgi:hypothetical protein